MAYKRAKSETPLGQRLPPPPLYSFSFPPYYGTSLLGGRSSPGLKKDIHFPASLAGGSSHVTQFRPMRYQHQLLDGLQGSSLKEGQTRLECALPPSSPISLVFFLPSTWIVAVMAGALAVILTDGGVEARRRLGPWRHGGAPVTSLQASFTETNTPLYLVKLCYLGFFFLSFFFLATSG